MIDGIFTAPASRLITAILLPLIAISPAMLFINEYTPVFFAHTDLGKLLLLACAIVVPHLLIIGIPIWIPIFFASKAENNLLLTVLTTLGVAVGVGAISLYLAVGVHFFLQLGGPRAGAAISLAVTTLLSASLTYYRLAAKRKSPPGNQGASAQKGAR